MTKEAQNIIKLICLKYNIDPEKIKQQSRKIQMVACKREIAYQLRTQLNMCYNDIEEILNIKPSTTRYHISVTTQYIKQQQIKQKRIQNREEQEKRQTKMIAKNTDKKMICEILDMFPEQDKKWGKKLLIEAINWYPKV